jgi:hypothetical protein
MTANEHGVTWAPSKSGRLQIALGADTPALPAGERQIEVWALYTGTHDVAPGTRRFTGPSRDADARAYANQLWERG